MWKTVQCNKHLAMGNLIAAYTQNLALHEADGHRLCIKMLLQLIKMHGQIRKYAQCICKLSDVLVDDVNCYRRYKTRRVL